MKEMALFSKISTVFHRQSRLTVTASIQTLRWSSLWSHVEQGPPDAIIGINEAFARDTHSLKMNLGPGAYRDDNGQPYVLRCIQEAEERLLHQKLDKEYFLTAGNETFTKNSARLAFGNESEHVSGDLHATIQGISGTGTLRVGAAFLQKFYPNASVAYLPSPSWANHAQIFNHAGIGVGYYRYYDKSTLGFDFNGCLEDLNNLPERSLVLLHACAHNPTGVDPTREEWREISAIMKKKNHLPFFDMAYQGFASGDLTNDAYALRLFVEDGHLPVLSQSYSKNMGLYGERVGAFTVLCSSKQEARAVESQLKILIRPMYSSPPIHGARLANAVLADESLYTQWLVEIKFMANRILCMRRQLKLDLEAAGSLRDWSHITKQIGMFCYSGLTAEQVDRLAKEYSIYLTRDGRISIVGITSKNVDYLAKAMHEITK